MKHQGTTLAILILLFFGSICSMGQSPTITLTQTASPRTLDSSKYKPSYTHKIFRSEFGFGYGFANGAEGGGGCGRVALSYLSSKWGVTARASIYDGEKGKETNGDWISFGPPVEKFNDKAILISYVISNRKLSQSFVSAGPGWVKGSKLNIYRNNLEDIGPFPGLAFELGLATTGSAVGFRMSLMGNLNSEVNLLGLVVSVTFGYQE